MLVENEIKKREDKLAAIVALDSEIIGLQKRLNEKIELRDSLVPDRDKIMKELDLLKEILSFEEPVVPVSESVEDYETACVIPEVQKATDVERSDNGVLKMSSIGDLYASERNKLLEL